MLIEIDVKSGFCPGVVAAIEKAEVELINKDCVYSLGDIMHNREEMGRLSNLGLRVVGLDSLDTLDNQTLLIRAHGEPPSTYQMCKKHNINLIDATCPVVARLQKRVVEADNIMSKVNGQVVILGKYGHPEVIGLQGQIEDAIVIDSSSELVAKVDFNRPIYLLSQTTQSLDVFKEIEQIIIKRYKQTPELECTIKDTICRQVSNRYPHLHQFAASHDVVIFVSGSESSNGKALFKVCSSVNENSYKVENADQVDIAWVTGAKSVGICGATSTPRWSMEQVRDKIKIGR
ncbi:MAG: 4-hydroxy-3-methylbut-2-enyl diphosphate reductase [Rikenellaceae bacterium]